MSLAEQYRQENERLRARLEEAEETLRAIRSGEVDALVVAGPGGQQVFTLKAADHPYRVLIEQMREGAMTLSEQGIVLYCNQHLAAILRRDQDSIIGRTFADAVAPPHRAAFWSLLEECRTAAVKAEIALEAADGTWVPTYLSASALVIEDVSCLCVVVTDLSQQKRTEEIVAAGTLARTILDQANEAILVCDTARRITHANFAAQRLFGGNLLGRPIEMAIHLAFGAAARRAAILPESVPASLEDCIDLSLSGEALSGIEVAPKNFKGASGDLLLSAGPIHGGPRQILGCVITLTDITEQKRAEQHLKLLAAELSHRVKNSLAVIQTIADQTLSRAASLPAFAPAFKGRLRALASVHGLLTQSDWQSADLRTLIEQCLMPHLTASRSNTDIQGPTTALPPRAALALNLVLHEMATNAAKYGSLSVKTGRVTVSWGMEDATCGRCLHLRWVERGGPKVEPPTSQGFGAELIRRMITYDLDGTVEAAFDPEGLCCDIVFPLAAPVPQTGPPAVQFRVPIGGNVTTAGTSAP